MKCYKNDKPYLLKAWLYCMRSAKRYFSLKVGFIKIFFRNIFWQGSWHLFNFYFSIQSHRYSEYLSRCRHCLCLKVFLGLVLIFWEGCFLICVVGFLLYRCGCLFSVCFLFCSFRVLFWGFFFVGSVVGLVCVFALAVWWGFLVVGGRGRLTCLFVWTFHHAWMQDHVC